MSKPETWCSLDSLELTEIPGSSFGQKPQIFWLKYFRLNGQGRDNLVYCLFILHYNLLYFKWCACDKFLDWSLGLTHGRCVSGHFGSVRLCWNALNVKASGKTHYYIGTRHDEWVVCSSKVSNVWEHSFSRRESLVKGITSAITENSLSSSTGALNFQTVWRWWKTNPNF